MRATKSKIFRTTPYLYYWLWVGHNAPQSELFHIEHLSCSTGRRAFFREKMRWSPWRSKCALPRQKCFKRSRLFIIIIATQYEYPKAECDNNIITTTMLNTFCLALQYLQPVEGRLSEQRWDRYDDQNDMCNHGRSISRDSVFLPLLLTLSWSARTRGGYYRRLVVQWFPSSIVKYWQEHGWKCSNQTPDGDIFYYLKR